MTSPSDSGQPGSWQTPAELVVLQAVRLAGFGEDGAIAGRAGPVAADLAPVDVPVMLSGLERAGLIEHFTFAGDGGWILTEGGTARCAALLREELHGSGAEPVLAEALVGFDGPNTRLVSVISQWQLRSLGVESGGGRHGGGCLGNERDGDAPGAAVRTAGAEVVRELAAIEPQLPELLAPLVARLPRFGRYPAQFSAALAQADGGDLRWIAGVGLLSCHTVWAELHQDLLSSLGRDRATDSNAVKGHPGGG